MGQDKIAIGLDIKGDGGYVLAPPSFVFHLLLTFEMLTRGGVSKQKIFPPGLAVPFSVSLCRAAFLQAH